MTSFSKTSTNTMLLYSLHVVLVVKLNYNKSFSIQFSLYFQSKQSNVTLLHFIVRTYMRSCGGALSDGCALPVPEPGDVARAATLDFADVATHLSTLRKQLDGKQRYINTIDHFIYWNVI